MFVAISRSASRKATSPSRTSIRRRVSRRSTAASATASACGHRTCSSVSTRAGRSPEPPIPAAWACPPCSWATRSSATPTPNWSPSSCACSCAPPTCSRRKPRNPSPRNTAASSRNSWARALRRKWPRSTSRRTPFSILKNSSPCSTAPRGRARPPSGWPTSPNFSPAITRIWRN